MQLEFSRLSAVAMIKIYTDDKKHNHVMFDTTHHARLQESIENVSLYTH